MAPTESGRDGVAYAVHAEGVGAARGARRAARHDHHHVTLLTPPDVEEGRLDVADHVVGVRHRRGDKRLGAPGQRELEIGRAHV